MRCPAQPVCLLTIGQHTRIVRQQYKITHLNKYIFFASSSVTYPDRFCLYKKSRISHVWAPFKEFMVFSNHGAIKREGDCTLCTSIAFKAKALGSVEIPGLVTPLQRIRKTTRRVVILFGHKYITRSKLCFSPVYTILPILHYCTSQRNRNMTLSEAKEALKVPKREISMTELCILSDPIWVGDLRNEPKNHQCKVLGRYLPFCFFTDD